jgi:exo-beta-1,3-glucanase (GH17 family)
MRIADRSSAQAVSVIEGTALTATVNRKTRHIYSWWSSHHLLLLSHHIIDKPTKDMFSSATMKLITILSTLGILCSALAEPPLGGPNNGVNGQPPLPLPTSPPNTMTGPAKPPGAPQGPFASTALPPGVGIPSAPFNNTVPLPPGVAAPTNRTFYRGFGVSAWQGGQNKPIKQQADWVSAFNRIKSTPGNFNAARTYAVQDTYNGVQTKALPTILAAANESNIDVLVGLYLGTNDNGFRFNQEFTVLKETLSQHGLSHIIGITVGNEDLYRLATPPAQLASQITQVQSWLDTAFPGNCIPVGHVDTWTEIVNTTNIPVTEASDFLVANIFPYWEKSTLNNSIDYFDAALTNITTFENTHGVEVWIGETGWPFLPAAHKSFVGEPGKTSMQRYWDSVVCSSGFRGRNSFYYIDCDEGDVPEWGVWDREGRARIEMGCKGGPV